MFTSCKYTYHHSARWTELLDISNVKLNWVLIYLFFMTVIVTRSPQKESLVSRFIVLEELSYAYVKDALAGAT